MAPFNLVTRVGLLLMLALVCQGARADTAIRLLKSFAGNVNFVGAQQTVRNKGNNKPCEVFSSSVDRTAILSGIPPKATILSAQLYWAGSNHNPDFTVVFDGETVIAEDGRRYYSTTIGNKFDYYSGAVDVTEQVKKKWADKQESVKNGNGNNGNGNGNGNNGNGNGNNGNGNGNGKKPEDYDKYSFRGLTVDTDAPYCAVEGVLGGFALLVVYSDDSEPFRMLNLYEGFQYMRYSGISLNLSGFRVPDPIGSATGRVAHITWEGDATLDGAGENLTFNGHQMTDSLNPSGNQFNSQSNIDNDKKSYGIDFDAYTVGYPVIKGGQTTASTRYESGQDLVLLSAEVVALPNVPMSDLSISMQLNGEMELGKEASYTIKVTNAGPSTESGPTVVTSTLPVGLTYVSASGVDWDCMSAGQRVTCTSTKALTAGSELAALKFTVLVTGTGTITNSALVTGTTYDPQMANNSVSVNSTVSDGEAEFEFTSAACVDRLPFGHTDQTCTKVLPAVTAGVSAPIFVTAVSAGVPTATELGAEVSMRFALSCHNPDESAGVKASFADIPLGLCQAEGKQPTSWSDSTKIIFEPKNPSVKKSFKYEDVGLVELFMQSGPANAVRAGRTFVSVPELRLARKSDAALPALTALAASPLDEKSVMFAKAGDLFELEVGAYTAGPNPKPAPNFGNEKPKATFALPKVEEGGIDIDHVPALIADPASDTTFPEGGKNWAYGKFSWAEVGVVKLTPALSTEKYLEAPYPSKGGYARFIPHHFTTSAKRMECLPNMKCDADSDISTAAYSKERIPVTVVAQAKGNTETRNYGGVFAHDVVLSAWTGAAKDQDKSASLKDRAISAGAFKKGSGKAHAQPFYELPSAFVHTSPQAAWSAPASIYLRATEVTGNDHVTSAGNSAYEVGIRIVSGRLLVPNAHGSERLNLPLKVSAQYWTGTNWELSKNDQLNIVDPGKAEFSNFGSLSLSLVSSTPQILVNGGAGFSVKVTPAVAGTADLIIDHMDWLPSTKGRLKFGTYKSPLIYLRELH